MSTESASLPPRKDTLPKSTGRRPCVPTTPGERQESIRDLSRVATLRNYCGKDVGMSFISSELLLHLLRVWIW
jgi:hypothetical protein